ncbi:MAG: protein kinase [Verrucomicrobiota bacterium]
MNTVEIEGYETLELIGEGVCGYVYRVRYEGQSNRALKVFKAMAVNRTLVEASLQRLFSLPPHPGIISLHEFDFRSRPSYYVTAFLAEEESTGPGTKRFLPQTLSRVVETLDYQGSTQLIRQIAEALAFLHKHGIAHCNLKPGNIFLTEKGKQVQLTDFGQGFVSGIYHLDPTTSLLYASPEQLTHPEGAEEGVAYGWDVFAFGVIAYRLLNKRFPRANSAAEAIQRAREAGEPLPEISPGELAEKFRDEPVVTWDKPAKTDAERQLREVIEVCLSLDAQSRYVDMREVLIELDRIDRERNEQRERDRLAREKKKAQRVLFLTRGGALLLALLLIAVAVTATVYQVRYRQELERNARIDEIHAEEIEAKENEVQAREAESLREVRDAKAVRDIARSAENRALVNLQRAQEATDRLFQVVRDRRPVSHPGFQAYEDEAEWALAFYDSFLEELEGNSLLRLERARALQNRADLLLDLDRDDAALDGYKEACVAWIALREGPDDIDPTEATMRLAESSLELSRLQFRIGSLELAKDAVRRTIDLMKTESEANPIDVSPLRLLAAGLVQEGVLARKEEDIEGAMARHQAAVEIYRRLARSEGREGEFRSRLARSYVNMGQMLQEQDDLEEAQRLHHLALSELMTVYEKFPQYQLPRYELACALEELGAIENQIGAPDAARDFFERAVEILEGLVEENDRPEEYRYHLALNLANESQFLRDEGQTESAMDRLERAIEFLQGLVEEKPELTYYRYQLALKEYQMAELLVDEQEYGSSTALAEKAVAKLEELLRSERLEASQQKQIQLSIAFLYGDLGHVLEEQENRQEAALYFGKAVDQWKVLAERHSGDLLIEDGLAWSEERLQQLEF